MGGKAPISILWSTVRAAVRGLIGRCHEETTRFSRVSGMSNMMIMSPGSSLMALLERRRKGQGARLNLRKKICFLI